MLRLLVSPRWLTWHVLTLGAMVTCGFLAAWQWGRAGTAMGSAVNVGYGLQWPLFALFFGYMWWRFLRMEAAALRETGHGVPAVEGTEGGAPTGATGSGASAGIAGAEEATASAGSAVSDGSASSDGSAAGRTASDGPAAAAAEATREAVPAAETAREAVPASGAGPAPRRSPFTPRPTGVEPARHTDPQLRAYNEELARLADRPQEETST